ncbi:38001_t:CDS:2, partial [Gigaspora margarita]
ESLSDKKLASYFYQRNSTTRSELIRCGAKINYSMKKAPYDVWLTIYQGISQHINCNAENFRNRFVKHEGQKELVIGVDDIL